MTPVATILQACPELSEQQAAAIASALDERSSTEGSLTGAPAPRPAQSGDEFEKLVDAQCVADTFGLSRDWVYDNAQALGARTLGNSKYARKRFLLTEAKKGLDAMALGAETPEPSHANPETHHREPRRSRASTEPGLTKSGNPLLPLPA